MPTSPISAVPTLGGLSIQVMASRHHQHPDGAATVAIIVPTGQHVGGPGPATSRILHLDARAAWTLAGHLCELAQQIEREAPIADITPQQLDAAVSDLVGLSPC